MVRRTLGQPQPPSTAESAEPVYRVEHATDDAVHGLGLLIDGVRHHRALDPFLSRLLHAGEAGELRLVDTATGEVAARRRVRPRSRSSPDSSDPA